MLTIRLVIMAVVVIMMIIMTVITMEQSRFWVIYIKILIHFFPVPTL